MVALIANAGEQWKELPGEMAPVRATDDREHAGNVLPDGVRWRRNFTISSALFYGAGAGR